MTFIKNKSLLSFFLTFTFLSGPAVAMKEEDFNQKSILIPQKNLPTGVPIGSIIAFAGDKEPEGWLMCDGLQYSSNKYPKLFEIIKTKYVPKEVRLNILDHNENNENKLFCVPDLRGRVLVGVDNGSNRVTSNNTLGATGGEEKHQLTIEEMPKHNHAIGEQFDIFSGDHATVCQINKRNRPPYISEDTGGNQTHNNMQPYLVSNYIIKAKQDEIVHEEKEIKLFKPLPLKPIKTSESLPTQKEFENNTAISDKTLILYKQIFSLNEIVEKLQQQMNPLIQENEELKIFQRGCAKAWIVFDGSNPDTLNSIGVKSVTRHGLGDYTINFSTPFNSENYCPIFHTWRKEQFGILLVHAYSMKSENREINTRNFYRFTVTQIQDNGTRADAFVSAAFYGN